MTNQLATRTTGYVWPGEDLSSALFLRNGTGSAWSETARQPRSDVPDTGIWHVLMNLVKDGRGDLDALRLYVAEVLNDRGPSSNPALLELLWPPTNTELTVQVGAGAPVMSVALADPIDEAAGEQPSHARLAREVRQMTDLPTASLASAVGVTREQYQRWLKGSPISNIRHGQLIFLHTIAADLSRRLGADPAHVWWRTPIEHSTTPEQLLRRRRLDEIHRLILAVPDRQPIVDGVLQTLPRQQEVDYTDDIEDEASDGENSWSPYGETDSLPR